MKAERRLGETPPGIRPESLRLALKTCREGLGFEGANIDGAGSDMTGASDVSFSLVTNASALDAGRLRLTLPHWLRTFGKQATELIVVVDPQPPSGRIAELHARAGSLDAVYDVLHELRRSDARLQWRVLPDSAELQAMLGGWFVRGRPVRCQAGTPIAAFVAAFEAASSPIVLRADCDMLFHEAGWLHAAIEALLDDRMDLLEPARCGWGSRTVHVSTRCSLLHMPRWKNEILPIRAWRLDWPRQVHRWWRGRPPWLSLEQMLDVERVAGRIRFAMLPESLGCSLHVARVGEADLPIMASVVAAMERGIIPSAQRERGANFDAAAWSRAA